MCQDKYFLCFENVRQHMQSRHSEDFTLIPNVINIIKLVAVNHATSSPAEKKTISKKSEDLAGIYDVTGRI